MRMAKNKASYFGVVNTDEALAVRKLTDKPILICAKVHTDEFKICKKNDLEIVVDDENDLKTCLKLGLKDNLHLKIDCGMNRFGVKSVLNCILLNDFLQENEIKLKSICTHFPYTENKTQTTKDYQNFMQMRSQITQNAPLCFGGSGIVKYSFPFDILRVGIGMYGYGQKKLIPVMKICSHVSKIFYAQKGEYIGYGKNYKVSCDGFFAIVPVGYGDGLKRNLSGKFYVKINGKKYPVVGNICMDCFFVKVDESVKVDDNVEVMTNANYLAKKSGTIPYEILTGFSSLRGQTLID